MQIILNRLLKKFCKLLRRRRRQSKRKWPLIPGVKELHDDHFALCVQFRFQGRHRTNGMT